MKTFYDLTDIESTLDIRIDLSLESNDSLVDILLRINGKVIQYTLEKSQKWASTEPLLEPLSIEITGTKDLYKVNNISIDDFSIIDYVDTNRNTLSFIINEPFYQWKHRITGQGLLIFTDRSGIW